MSSAVSNFRKTELHFKMIRQYIIADCQRHTHAGLDLKVTVEI